MRPPIPVTVISGFLGAGKTTLLCELLQHRQERRLAVLVNELGDVSIDGALARASADSSEEVEVVDFPSGLIAYADDGQFVPALQEIGSRPGRVDQVLIETSGVALPTAAMARLQTAELAASFVLDATLVIVDTPRMLAGDFDLRDGVNAAGVLFDQQLAAADVVVLNKIDALDPETLLAAEAAVRRRAPNVRFLELAHGAQLDSRLALGLRLHQGRRQPHFHGPFAPVHTLTDHGRIDGHSHSGLLAHTHGLATHTHFHEQDPGWLSFTLRSDAPQDIATLIAALERAAAAEPLLRCKGFVRGTERVLIQGVRTRFVASPERPSSGSREDGAARASELVFIGYHLSRARVARLLNEMTATTWR